MINIINLTRYTTGSPVQKMRWWARQNMQTTTILQQEDMRANRPAIGQIYDAYAKRCFKNGAMDFDDLLIEMYELLKNFPEA